MSATTTPAIKNAKDLVAETLAAMGRAGSGDGDAAAELAAKSAAASGKTSRPGRFVAPVTPTAIKPKGLRSVDKVIIRPNGQEYHVRTVGDHDDIEILRESRRRGVAVLLYGIPGTGKTAMFEAAFVADGFQYVPGTGDTEVSDFVGGYVPLPGGGFMWVDGPLIIAMREGLPLLVDECALIDSRVMAVVYSAMDGRGRLKVTANPELPEIEAKEGFIVFGACNPRAPGARMSEALLSRFQLHMEVGVDFQLMRKMGVPTDFVTAAGNMKKKYDANEMGWFPSIREMLAFMQNLDIFGETMALNNVVAMAPEMDRPQVADVLTRAYGKEVRALEIK